jgi:hypothetical protein
LSFFVNIKLQSKPAGTPSQLVLAGQATAVQQLALCGLAFSFARITSAFFFLA